MKKVLLVLLATSVLTSCGYMEDMKLRKAEKIETLRINDSISSAKIAALREARELEKAEAKAKKEKTINSLKANFDIRVDEFTQNHVFMLANIEIITYMLGLTLSTRL